MSDARLQVLDTYLPGSTGGTCIKVNLYDIKTHCKGITA